MSNQNQTDIDKATKQGILDAPCNQIDQRLSDNKGGKLQYGYLAKAI